MQRSVRSEGVAKQAFIAAMLACLMLLQIVVAGVASAAADDTAPGLFSIACAPQTGGSTGDAPAAPITHRHGACCILHNGALADPSPGPVSILILAHPTLDCAPLLTVRIDAVIRAPELYTLSPRAPPAIAA